MEFRILMADGDAQYSESVSSLFQRNGVAVVCSGNGDAALRLFYEERFDLVLLDVMLSGGIDGFYVAERIRSRDPEVPIIFVTTRMDMEDIQQGFGRCRADDYIAKPTPTATKHPCAWRCLCWQSRARRRMSNANTQRLRRSITKPRLFTKNAATPAVTTRKWAG